MSDALLTVTLLFVAAVDPPRVWPALPDEPAATRRAAGLAAAVVSLAVVAVLAAVADPLLDGLDIDAETFRIGAGGLLLLAAFRNLLIERVEPEPGLPGWRAGLVPLAFPFVLGPEVAGLALSAGADHGVATTVVAATVALAVLAVGALVRPPTGPRATIVLGAGRLLGGLLAVLAVDLLIDGIKAV